MPNFFCFLAILIIDIILTLSNSLNSPFTSSICNSGQYYDPINDICQSCIQGCQLCIESTKCIKCMPEKFANTNHTSCLSCQTNCKICKSLTECEICKDTYQLIQGKCILDRHHYHPRYMSSVDTQTTTSANTWNSPYNDTKDSTQSTEETDFSWIAYIIIGSGFFFIILICFKHKSKIVKICRLRASSSPSSINKDPLQIPNQEPNFIEGRVTILPESRPSQLIPVVLQPTPRILINQSHEAALEATHNYVGIYSSPPKNPNVILPGYITQTHSTRGSLLVPTNMQNIAQSHLPSSMNSLSPMPTFVEFAPKANDRIFGATKENVIIKEIENSKECDEQDSIMLHLENVIEGYNATTKIDSRNLLDGSLNNLPVDYVVDQNKEKMKCQICQVNISDVVLLECRHLMCCEKCAIKLKEEKGKCPSCDNIVQDFVKLAV